MVDARCHLVLVNFWLKKIHMFQKKSLHINWPVNYSSHIAPTAKGSSRTDQKAANDARTPELEKTIFIGQRWDLETRSHRSKLIMRLMIIIICRPWKEPKSSYL